MPIRDFGLLFLVCMVWGLNVIVTRWVFLNSDVQPVFYAALRFGLIALVLLPILFRRVPKNLGKLFLISTCMGSAHFALLFIGLANASGSAAAVVGQLGVPFTTILSIIFLSEKVRWRRGLGIALAFHGVIVITVDPASFNMEVGLFFVIGSAFVGAMGAIMMKQITPMPAIHMQAWMGAMSCLPLLLVSMLLNGWEGGVTGQFEAFVDGGVMIWLATLFAVFGVSIFGHGTFYWLITRHEMTLLSPLTLMTPIWGVAFGVLILGETITVKFLIGGVVSLLGVLIIALRPNSKFPLASVAKKLLSGT